VSNRIPALEILDVSKDYRGLRPLRLERLSMAAGERIAISGIDRAAGEVLVGLITGAALPDRGEIRVHGRRTSDIAGDAEWLAWLDRFGVVSHRAALLDASTVAQNLALPFTLEIDPIGEDVGERVTALALEAGLDTAVLDEQAARLSAAARLRVHLGRALALDPALLLLEHPTVGFGKGESRPFGDLVARAARTRSLSVLTISEDDDLSRAVADRRFRLEPATGALRSARRWL
jgi:ABC-type transporter Mla maintaining outer membrane lipid asymmetry ATPase subunit MlaF